MKKILQVSGSMNVGGTETMLMNLYKNIDKNLVQFDFIEYEEEESFYSKEIKSLGGKIIKLKSPSEIGFVASVRELKKAIKENGPYDVVHAHTLFNCGIAVLAAKLAGVKIRISHAHTNQEVNYSLPRKMYYSVMRVLIRTFSNEFLGASKMAGDFLFGESITQSKKYSFLPNYIDYESILNSNKNIREEFNIKKDELVIGSVGRFIRIKNQELILKVAKEINSKTNLDFKVLLVGDGALKEYLKEKIDEMGLEDKVLMTGYRKDVTDIIHAMDVFILPSLFEGFGMVTVEAQIAGVPCVVSDVLPNEIDLNIGLVERCSLNDDISIWADKVLKFSDKKIYSKKVIKNAIESNGFMKEDILKKIYNTYGVE